MLLPLLLSEAADGMEHNVNDLIETLAGELDLTADDRRGLLTSGRD